MQSQSNKTTFNSNADREIVVTVSPDFTPEDGTAFDAVVSALEFFNIPAVLVSRKPEVPTAVIEIECGAIHAVHGTQPMRVILLDADTEGSDGQNVHHINGEEVYVHDFSICPGSESLDKVYGEKIAGAVDLTKQG